MEPPKNQTIEIICQCCRNIFNQNKRIPCLLSCCNFQICSQCLYKNNNKIYKCKNCETINKLTNLEFDEFLNRLTINKSLLILISLQKQNEKPKGKKLEQISKEDHEIEDFSEIDSFDKFREINKQNIKDTLKFIKISLYKYIDNIANYFSELKRNKFQKERGFVKKQLKDFKDNFKPIFNLDKLKDNCNALIANSLAYSFEDIFNQQLQNKSGIQKFINTDNDLLTSYIVNSIDLSTCNSIQELIKTVIEDSNNNLQNPVEEILFEHKEQTFMDFCIEKSKELLSKSSSLSQVQKDLSNIINNQYNPSKQWCCLIVPYNFTNFNQEFDCFIFCLNDLFFHIYQKQKFMK